MNSAVAQGPVALLDTVAPTRPPSCPRLQVVAPRVWTMNRRRSVPCGSPDLPPPRSQSSKRHSRRKPTPSRRRRPRPTPKVNAWADSAGPAGDLFRQYLREIGRVPLLNAVLEVELAQAVEAGLFAEEKLTYETSLKPQLRRELAILVLEGQAAKRRLIEANLRLVVSIAKRYLGPRHVDPGPGPGRQPRPDPRGGEVRLHPRLQVLHLRDLVDPAGHEPRAGRPGPHHPGAGARRRADEPRGAAAAPAAAGERRGAHPGRHRRGAGRRRRAGRRGAAPGAGAGVAARPGRRGGRRGPRRPHRGRRRGRRRPTRSPW